MKKSLLKTTAIALALTAFAFNAKADDNKRLNDGLFFQPYVGLGYVRTQADFKTIGGIDYSEIYANGYNSINIFAGTRIHKHLGFELGYSHSDSQNVTKNFTLWGAGWQGQTDTKLKAYTLDALGYFPLPKNNKIELIGLLGLGHYKADVKYTLTVGALSASDKASISKTALPFRSGNSIFYKR